MKNQKQAWKTWILYVLKASGFALFCFNVYAIWPIRSVIKAEYLAHEIIVMLRLCFLERELVHMEICENN